MSYYFTMNFVACENKGAALELMSQAGKNLFESRKAFIEEEAHFIPSVRYAYSNKHNMCAENELWVLELFQQDFVWWEEHKLLALQGGAWPNSVTNLFAKSVYFQNSCDQDYAFSEWEGIHPFFDQLLTEVRSASRERILELKGLGYPGFDPTDYQDSDTEYLRRSAMYNAVYHKLGLDEWLYGVHIGTPFERYTMTPIDSTERGYDVKRIVASVAQAYNQN